MKLKQKIISVFSAASCAISFCAGSVAVSAETYSDEMKNGEYLSYKQVDANLDGIYDYVEISDCDESVAEVTVPEKIDGLPVKSIKSAAFFNCYFLKKLYLPEGLESIGDNAFVNCRYLESIDIPDSVTSMGRYVFQNCFHLTEVKWSEGLTEIGEGTFLGCRSLSAINIPKNVTALAESAFLGCSELRYVVIPDSVKSIDSGAFSNGDSMISSNLTGISIENPNCYIYDSENVFPPNAVIYGYEGSTAYAYSLKYGRKFVALNDGPMITTTSESSPYHEATKTSNSHTVPTTTTLSQETRPTDITYTVTTTAVSSSYYEATTMSGNHTVPKTTASYQGTGTTYATATHCSEATKPSTPNDITGWKTVEVSCEASANNVVLNSTDQFECICLELLSDMDVEAVVYPELPDGFYVLNISGRNGNDIKYNGAQEFFVMTDNRAYVQICVHDSVKAGKYQIGFNIKQEKYEENSNHDGGTCYVYKYNITGGEFTVNNRNEIIRDASGDGELTVATKNEILGDVNGDGKTTIVDVVGMQKYLFNFKTITKETLKKLDLNDDGRFNIFDMAVLKKQIIDAEK
ncbi:MAG: leucine-rich repeat protein [Ruminococcus sp.]|nr:leucine-rich repeat protein [Ruminococcus sp.]